MLVGGFRDVGCLNKIGMFSPKNLLFLFAIGKKLDFMKATDCFIPRVSGNFEMHGCRRDFLHDRINFVP